MVGPVKGILVAKVTVRQMVLTSAAFKKQAPAPATAI